jgi:hypothetical protein
MSTRYNFRRVCSGNVFRSRSSRHFHSLNRRQIRSVETLLRRWESGMDPRHMALLRKHRRRCYRLPPLYFRDNKCKDNNNMPLSHLQDMVAPPPPLQGPSRADLHPDKNHTFPELIRQSCTSTRCQPHQHLASKFNSLSQHSNSKIQSPPLYTSTTGFPRQLRSNHATLSLRRLQVITMYRLRGQLLLTQNTPALLRSGNWGPKDRRVP